MGKRELLLIVLFVTAGAVVYQATAPPAGPDDRRLSISRLIEAARREIGGNRASTVLTTSATIPLAPDVTELRIVGHLNELELIGEQRTDVDAALRVHSRAYTEDEAKQHAEETVLKKDPAGTSLILSIDYPRPGSQRASLTLKVPARVVARIESRPARLSISSVAGVEATNSGGETVISHIQGRVAVTHRGGTIRIEDVGTLKFTGRSAEAKIIGVKGDASFLVEHGGDLSASQMSGPLEVETRDADLTLENLEPTRGPIRINATNGSVTMQGLKSEARVNARDTELKIVMTGAAPLSVYTEGEDVALTPPSGGFQLDAVVRDGQIAPEPVLQKLHLEISSDDAVKETRAAGAVRGGGPTITVRATRADLTLVEPDQIEKPSTQTAPQR